MKEKSVSNPLTIFGLTILLLFLSTFPSAYAQGDDPPPIPANVRFEHVTIEDGLPSNTVFTIIQDSTGFLWFGTQRGLARYDGYQFTSYRHNPDDPHSIGHNFVSTLYEHEDGALWIGTFGGGLNILDPATGRFTRYQHNPDDPHSLSHNSVRVIYKAQDGAFWLGTFGGGLNKFDMETGQFTRYQNDPDDPHSLSHNRVWAIYEDRNGVFWVATWGGLNKFDPETGHFTRYLNNPDDPHSLSDNEILSFYEDKAGQLWIGTRDGGLNRFDRETERFSRYQHNPDDPHSLSHNSVWYLYEDQAGLFWIGTGGGVNIFDPTSERFIRYQHNPDDPYSLSNNIVYAIYEDQSGVLWMGTFGGGLSKFSRSKIKFAHYRHIPGNPNSLSSNDVRVIYEDSQGNLWIGVNDGLNKLDKETGQYTLYQNDPDDPHSLSDNQVLEIVEDQSGVLWVGTQNGGLNKFDAATEQFTRYQHDPDDPHSLSNDFIYALYEDRAGDFWVGTRTGGLDRMDRQSGRFTTYTFADTSFGPISGVGRIYEDRNGTLWISATEALIKFDPQLGVLASYQPDPNDPGSLSDTPLQVLETQAGEFWVGTNAGLNKFDPDQETFTRYTEADGLADNAIVGILEDGQGYLWISTQHGLSRFDPRDESFTNFDASDGLQSDQFTNPRAAFKGAGGELFFGGINGFNAFYPEDITDNPYVPPVILTDFQLFNQSVSVGNDSPLEKPIWETDSLTLNYDQNIFSFEFASLSYTAPEKNRYRYKLDGFEETWNEVDSNRRFVTYTNLEPGSYTFRVQGSNDDGVWNEAGVSLNITITPSWWQTTWFRVLAGLLVVGLAAGAFVGQRQSGIRRERQLETQVAERTKELRDAQEELIRKEKLAILGQLSGGVAHELRNPLGVISNAIYYLQTTLPDADETTKEYLEMISSEVHNSEKMVSDLLDLSRTRPAEREELAASELVDQALEKRPPPEKVKVTTEIAPDLPPLSVDPRQIGQVLTNLVTNAYQAMPKGGRLTIEAKGKKDKVYLSITDTGCGISEENMKKLFQPLFTTKARGIGLGLAVSKNLVEANGGSIEVESEEGKGSTFTVMLPTIGGKEKK